MKPFLKSTGSAGAILGLVFSINITAVIFERWHSFWGLLLLGCGVWLVLCLISEGLSLFTPLRRNGIWLGLSTLIVMVTFFLYARPAERILGREDQGTYSSSAIHLANTGKYSVHAPVLRLIPREFNPLFFLYEPLAGFSRQSSPPRQWLHHIGFLVEGDQIIPVFPPGYPVWLASVYSWGGWRGLAYQGYLLLILTSLALSLLIQKVWEYCGTPAHDSHDPLPNSQHSHSGMGPNLPPNSQKGTGNPMAVWGGLLYLLMPLALWLARTYYAENLLVLVWLLAIWWLLHEPCPWSSFAAGIWASLSLLIKVEGIVILLATLIGLAGGILFRRTKFNLPLFSGLVIGLAPTALWFATQNTAYFDQTLLAVGGIRSLALFAALLLVTGVFAWQLNRHPPLKPDLLHRYMIHAVILFLFLLSLYGYFIRPHPGNPDQLFYWPTQSLIKSYREDTFYRLGWYLTPAGLGVAVIGTLLLLRRISWNALGLFWITGLSLLIYLSYDLKNSPAQPYAMRRMIPFCLPLLVMGMAYGASLLPRRSSLLLILILILATTPLNLKLNRTPIFPGVREQLESLASRLPDKSILVTSTDEPGTFLVSPLQVMYGKNALALQIPEQGSPDERAYRKAFERCIQHFTAHGWRIFLLSENPGRFTGSGIKTVPLFQDNITTRYFINRSESLDLNIHPWEYSYSVSEMVLHQ